jgi:fucose 4-O-acetylase-like acetyltransferase
MVVEGAAMSRRLSELDMAKGTAMTLVVVGHVVSRGDIAPGAEWYGGMRALIYLFHMPLFMVLSGMALGVSWRHRAQLRDVASLIRNRVQHLMIPFIVFGVVIVAGKLLAAHWTKIDNPPASFTQGVASIFFNPDASASAFLWYIQVLSVYFLFVPWLLQFAENWVAPVLLVLGVALQGAGGPHFLNLDLCLAYLPFFSLGIVLGQHWPMARRTLLKPQYWWLWLMPFAGALLYSGLKAPLPKWLVGAVCIPFMLTVHENLGERVRSGLTFIGQHTLSIYLMNTIFIGLSKALLKPFVPWRGDYFYIHFVVLGAAGLLLPIVVKRLVDRTQPALSAYI